MTRLVQWIFWIAYASWILGVACFVTAGLTLLLGAY